MVSEMTLYGTCCMGTLSVASKCLYTIHRIRPGALAILWDRIVSVHLYIGPYWPCSFRVMRADRQTDRPTHYSILHRPSRGRNNQSGRLVVTGE